MITFIQNNTEIIIYLLVVFSSIITYKFFILKSKKSLSRKEFEDWLAKRIAKTLEERENTEDLQIKINKGCKLTTYKEIINYLNSHK